MVRAARHLLTGLAMLAGMAGAALAGCPAAAPARPPPRDAVPEWQFWQPRQDRVQELTGGLQGMVPANPAHQLVARVNQLVASCADGRRIFSADPGPTLPDADGTPAMTNDGLHLTPLGCEQLSMQLEGSLRPLLRWAMLSKPDLAEQGVDCGMVVSDEDAKRRGGTVARRALLAAPAVLVGLPAAAQQSGLVDIGQDGWIFSTWDRMQRVDQTALTQTLRLLSQAIVSLREGRMDVVICIVPSRGKVMQRFLPQGQRITPEIARRYSQSAEELRKAGALVPALDERFAEAYRVNPAYPLFFKTDTHWTPIGAEVAAVEIARQMRERLQMPPSPRPGTRLGNLRRVSYAGGNLLPFLTAAQRAAVQPEEMYIREILPPEGGAAALIEDDTADVTVVGTSNVQPRYNFQPVLSNQLLRPVALSWKPNNQGPYYALLEYLKSPDFQRQRPRALVWNLIEYDLATPPSSENSWRQMAIPNDTFLSEIRRLVAVR